jgi:hypothetical protein
LAVFSQVDSFESRALCPHGPRHVMKVTRFLLLGCYSVGAASNPSELTVAPGTLRDEFAVYEQATPSGSVDGPFLFTDFTDLASDRGGIPVAAPAPNPSPDAKDDAEQGSRFGWLTDDESRFVARANAGNYAQAVALAAATGTIPDITAHRYLEAKTGYGASVEQSLSPSVALWARGMWCDCKVEQYAFTEIDNSMHIFQEYSHEHQH